MFGSYVVSSITGHINRAEAALSRGDTTGALQATAQAAAVAAAAMAGGMYAASIKPLEGLYIAFNSLKSSPGAWAAILRKLGLDALDASRAQSIIGAYGAAELAARALGLPPVSGFTVKP